MDYKSYALLAQWLNGMSFAVNSYLIPIQLCGGKKTKCHRYKCIYGISVFLPRFNALPITITIESASFIETTLSIFRNALLYLLLLTMDCGGRERGEAGT